MPDSGRRSERETRVRNTSAQRAACHQTHVDTVKEQCLKLEKRVKLLVFSTSLEC